ncbi:MAG: hypothetical protein LC737_10690, partial [Chloroflexi bacterium]|nr:hypothetical protein [Chloroflexota bacterium]
FLYHGYQLDGAMQWRAQHEDTLDDSARAFLDASKAAYEREQQQSEERQAREREIEKRRAISDALADERDRQFRFLKQAGGGALGVGLGFALGFALLTYFKSAALLPNLLIGVVALAFLTMFPIGAAIGFGMGLCLWRWQAQPKRKWLAMLLVCAPLSAIAFALYVAVAAPPLNAGHLIVGALLGAGLGVSAALARTRTQRLLFIPTGTALAAILSALFSDLWSNNFALALICGLSIGALGGLGFYVFASADQASQWEAADARA